MNLMSKMRAPLGAAALAGLILPNPRHRTAAPLGPIDAEPHVAKLREFYTRRPRPWRGWPGRRRVRA